MPNNNFNKLRIFNYTEDVKLFYRLCDITHIMQVMGWLYLQTITCCRLMRIRVVCSLDALLFCAGLWDMFIQVSFLIFEPSLSASVDSSCSLSLIDESGTGIETALPCA